MLYPFTAIVGQDEMKLALLLNAIKSICRWCVNRGGKRALPNLRLSALWRTYYPLWRQGLRP